MEPLVIAEVATVVSDPMMQRLICEEVDRRISAAQADHGGTEATLRAEQKELEEWRERILDAIEMGTLTGPVVDPRLAKIRTGLERVESDLSRLDVLKAATSDVARERDRLTAHAADFPARARELKGYALRELLRPWLEDARFHKETRELTLGIRRIPAAAGLLGPAAPVTDSARPRAPLLTERVVLLSPAGAARGSRKNPKEGAPAT